MSEVKAVNWKSYQNIFPERYWGEGAFDVFLQNHMTKHWKNGLRVLDVGCGVFGTVAIKEWLEEGLWDSLDTSCDAPLGYGKVEWGNLREKTYDLIVIRGAINYLSHEELGQLSKALKENGILLANTFLNKPSSTWKETSYTTNEGVVGVERSRCVNDIIEHELVLPQETIKHTFFYHTKDVFEKCFGAGYFDWQTHGKNSFVLSFKKQ